MIRIPLSKPDITNKEIKAVLNVLKSNVLSLGPNLKELEEKMAKFSGVKYAVAVNGATSALHLIIRALGIKQGDEVITTPFSFIASSNCALYERVKPVFVDINGKTLNIDVRKIEEKITSKTKAIIAVDVFSQPADWEELEKIAKKHNLFLIEDSAEALGSRYKGKMCGSFGNAGVFAFYPNKQITTGEGGVILTNEKNIYESCKSMSNQGRAVVGEKWLEHEILGYNYRLDEMSCALGIVQLKRIKDILRKRKKVASIYNKKLKGLVEIPYIKEGNDLSWFVYVVRLPVEINRDKVISDMARLGIQCKDYFQPIHLQPFYKKEFGYKEGDFPVCEEVSKRTIALPFFNDLKEKEIDFIAKSLKQCLKKQ